MSKSEHSEVANRIPALIAIGGSAGGIEALKALLPWLPVDLPAPVVIALHLAPSSRVRSLLPEILRHHTHLPVQWARQGETLRCGKIYVAPQDHHTEVTEFGSFVLRKAEVRPCPSIDVLFDSMAATFGARVTGIVLSGLMRDGAAGARRISEAGGTVMVQNRETSLQFEMPEAALATGVRALVLPARVLAAALTTMLMSPGARPWFQLSAASSYGATAAAV